jgi:4-amino-4-deoxy-L-arabinose transferase-like glycosyltransferase
MRAFLTPIGVAAAAAILFCALTQSLGAAGFGLLTGVVVATPISAGMMLVFGVPTYLLMKRRRLVSLRAYLVVGLLISCIPTGLLIADDLLGSVGNEAQILMSRFAEMVALISGPLAALVFWKTARPDMDQLGQPLESNNL